MKYLLPLILLLTTVVAAQDTRAAGDVFPIDEFGDQYCDEFKARIDNFYIQLNLNPTNRGYFVVSGSKETLANRLYLELLLASAIADRAFDPARVTVVHGEEAGPLKVQLWVVPADADNPKFHNVQWDFKLAPGHEPVLLRAECSQICSPSRLGELAQKLVAANPDGRMYIVVQGPTRRSRLVELERAKRKMAKLGITRARYFIRASYDPHYPYPHSDYYFAVGDRDRKEF